MPYKPCWLWAFVRLALSNDKNHIHQHFTTNSCSTSSSSTTNYNLLHSSAFKAFTQNDQGYGVGDGAGAGVAGGVGSGY